MPGTDASRKAHAVLATFTDANHGALTDDLAVFGTTGAAQEPPPQWIFNDTAVRARVEAKGTSTLRPSFWFALAHLARDCATLHRVLAFDATIPTETLHTAIRRATHLAQLLPKPPTSLLVTPPMMRGSHARAGARAEPLTSAIEAAAERLCRHLDDPGWVEPDDIAGTVTDAEAALAGIAQPALVALDRATNNSGRRVTRQPASRYCSPGRAFTPFTVPREGRPVVERGAP